MAHNAYIHGPPSDPTAWLPGYVVTQLDFQTIDLLLFQSLNADLGGTWAPASRIIIGGAGVEFDTTGGNFNITGSGSTNWYSSAIVFTPDTADFFGGALIIDNTGPPDIQITAAVTFNAGFNVHFDQGLIVTTGDVEVVADNVVVDAGNITVTLGDVVVTAGDLNVVAGLMHVGGNVQFDAALSAAGTCTLGDVVTSSVSVSGGAVIINGTNTTSLIPLVLSGGSADLSVGGTSSFTGAVTLASTANVSLASIVTPTGVGRVRKRPAVTVTDSNYTFLIGDGDTFLIPALGANRTGTVSTTGAAEGDRMHLNAYANTTANTMSVLGATSFLANSTGNTIFLDLLFTSGAWIVDDYHAF